jgi:hypothetical protein
MKKKLLGLVLSLFILVPTFASAKMIKFGEGKESIYVNEAYIYQLEETKKGCKIVIAPAISSKSYSIDEVNMSCEQYIKEKQIEVK